MFKFDLVNHCAGVSKMIRHAKPVHFEHGYHFVDANNMVVIVTIITNVCLKP
jgi:hypothetical protein